MARPKGEEPPRNSGLPVRFSETERDYIEAAKDADYRKNQQEQGLPVPATASFVRAGAFERARRILGMTLEEFAKSRAKPEVTKS
jgi:hypothetical protein